MKHTKQVKVAKAKKNNEEILSELGKGINEKLRYLTRILNEHYENDKSFYLQRHEYMFLANFIIKDNVFISDSPIFMYNGKRFECDGTSLLNHQDNLLALNWQCVFHDINRNKRNGNLVVNVKILTEDLIDD